jgi:hypothetical protein
VIVVADGQDETEMRYIESMAWPSISSGQWPPFINGRLPPLPGSCVRWQATNKQGRLVPPRCAKRRRLAFRQSDEQDNAGTEPSATHRLPPTSARGISIHTYAWLVVSQVGCIAASTFAAHQSVVWQDSRLRTFWTRRRISTRRHTIPPCADANAKRLRR